MEKQLKSYQYYSDLYDKFTVEYCRDIEKFDAEVKLPEDKITEKETPQFKEYLSRLHMYFETGERYIKKSDRIKQWVEKDERYDEIFEQAKAPENISCLVCDRLMFVESKHLDFSGKGEANRVMFFYDCPLKHKPMRVFYDNGEEYKIKNKVCIKCNSIYKEESWREKDLITTTYTCTKCGYSEQSDLDLFTKEEKIDPDFIKDRNRFCLSDEEGQKYIEAKASLQRLGDILKESKEKEKNKDLYDKVDKLKKLKIIDLEKLLLPILESANYVKLQFQTPQVSRDVYVPFIVYDSKPERNEYESKHNLQKLIKKSLEDTNWRLMSDGVNYRLGMLEGRLRAYEREEDLIKLIKEK